MIRAAISPKPRRGRCRVCHCAFTKARSIQPVCDKFECKVQYASQVAAKSAAKRVAEAKRRDAATTKARKEAIKTRSDYLKDAQAAFNAFIRARDMHQPCICCGQPLAIDAVGGGYDCGHYRSVGSAPHLRFDERNAHGQRKQCNRYGAGRAVDYRIGLIRREGLAEVEALEADQTPRKWTIEELKAITVTYREKRKALLKEKA